MQGSDDWSWPVYLPSELNEKVETIFDIRNDWAMTSFSIPLLWTNEAPKSTRKVIRMSERRRFMWQNWRRKGSRCLSILHGLSSVRRGERSGGIERFLGEWVRNQAGPYTIIGVGTEWVNEWTRHSRVSIEKVLHAMDGRGCSECALLTVRRRRLFASYPFQLDTQGWEVQWRRTSLS